MAENMKVDRTKTDDGRRVEQRVFESVVDGVKERVVETHVEQIPMTLQERVVEKIAPVVTARKREVYKEGKLVDTVVEELDNGSVKMQAAAPAPNSLTKDDLVAAIREVLAPAAPAKVAATAPLDMDDEEAPAPVVKKKRPVFHEPAPAPVVNPLVTVPTQNSKLWDGMEMVLWVVLSGELAFCVYHLFLKNWL